MEQNNNALVSLDTIKAKVTMFLKPVSGIVVNDKLSNISAGATLKGVKDFKKEIEDQRKAAVAPYNNMVDKINNYAKELKAPLDGAEIYIKTKMQAFANQENARLEQERKAAAAEAAKEQARLDAIKAEEEAAARKRAEEEAKRLEAKLKAERKLAEEKAREEKSQLEAFGLKPDKELQDAAKEAQQQKEEEARIALKARLEEERIARQAQIEREQAQTELDAMAKAKQLELERPKNTRTTWHFEIESPSEIPDEYWQISESAIGAAVRGGVRKIPGVKIYSKESIVAGR